MHGLTPEAAVAAKPFTARSTLSLASIRESAASRIYQYGIFERMSILGVRLLMDFEMKYPPSRKAFRIWRQVVEQAQWSNLSELQLTFSAADYVAPHIVFNMVGNKYRIITLVKFPLKLLQIEAALTHEQYNRWKP